MPSVCIEFNYDGTTMTINKRDGYTLSEVIIAIGLLAFVGLIASSLFFSLKSSEVGFEEKNDYIRFVADLTLYAHRNCAAAGLGLVNKTIDPNPSTDPMVASDILVDNFWKTGSGEPAKLGVAPPALSILSGTPSQPRLRLKKLGLLTSFVPPTTVVVGTEQSGGINTFKRYVVQIVVVAEQIKDNLVASGAGQFEPLEPKFIDIPVYVNASNVIQSCEIQLQEKDICSMVGSKYMSYGISSGSAQSCVAQSQCQVRGAYASASCSPSYNPCPGNMPNPATGGYNCPSGTVDKLSGQYSSSFQVSCGKKCTYTVNDTVRMHLCMACYP